MLEIHYDEKYCSCSDFDVMKEAEKIAENYKYSTFLKVQTSTGMLVDAIRIMVIRGKIPHDEVRILFKDKVITIDKYVQYSEWPKGFLDTFDDILDEIIDFKFNRNKEK